jgi:hypothetical protein
VLSRTQDSGLRTQDSGLRTQDSGLRTQDFSRLETGALPMNKADFRTFYRDAHAVECLTEREKMLIGLSVAMMRLCDP